MAHRRFDRAHPRKPVLGQGISFKCLSRFCAEYGFLSSSNPQKAKQPINNQLRIAIATSAKIALPANSSRQDLLLSALGQYQPQVLARAKHRTRHGHERLLLTVDQSDCLDFNHHIRMTKARNSEERTSGKVPLWKILASNFDKSIAMTDVQ